MSTPKVAASKHKPSKHASAEPASAGEKPHASGAHAASAPPPPARMSHAEVRKIFFGLMLAAFLAALNQTIIATALPTMGRYFSDFENLPWVVTAYLLTSTAVAPLYGKLSDIYGRRAMMLTAVGIFIAGSVICAVAPNMLLLILGRAAQGIGGGGILPIAQAIIADVVLPRERGRYQAYMGVVWVSAGVGGPIFGGVLSEHFHWSLIFWLNIPLGLTAAFLTQTYLKRIPRHDRKHELDVLGAALMMASAVPLLLALSWGGTRYAWLSPTILGLIASSMLLSLAFAWRLVRAREPFLPLSVLANPVMRMGTFSTSFAMATSISLTIFTPLYFEVVQKLSATDAGLALIPLALTTPGSLISGRVMLRGHHYKWVPMVGLVFSIVMLSLLVWKPDLTLPAVIAILSVVGTAIGMTYPVTTVSIQNAMPQHQVGVAMGAMNFFRSLASAFAVAVMGAIILAGFGAAPERGMSVSGIAAAVGAQGFDVAGVFRWVFLAALVFLLASLLGLILMEERPLRGPGSADPPPSA
jgi:EmrB/QacA subfamily drug resistance transporter